MKTGTLAQLHSLCHIKRKKNKQKKRCLFSSKRLESRIFFQGIFFDFVNMCSINEHNEEENLIENNDDCVNAEDDVNITVRESQITLLDRYNLMSNY